MATVGKRMLSKLSLWSGPAQPFSVLVALGQLFVKYLVLCDDCCIKHTFINTHRALQLWIWLWLLPSDKGRSHSDYSVVLIAGFSLKVLWVWEGESHTASSLCFIFSSHKMGVKACVLSGVLSVQHFGRSSNTIGTRHRTKRMQGAFPLQCPQKSLKMGEVLHCKALQHHSEKSGQTFEPKLHPQLNEVTGNFWGRWGELESN